MQLHHHDNNFIKKIFPITLVCDNITNAPNIGSMFRIADAFGIEKLIFCGSHIPIGRRMTKTSRATEKTVNYEVHEDATEVVSNLKMKGYYIISLEITSNSQPISNFIFPAEKSIIIVVGDENLGVSEAILQQSDAIIHIDMFGQNSSMNVVNATSIAFYEITKQLCSKF